MDIFKCNNSKQGLELHINLGSFCNLECAHCCSSSGLKAQGSGLNEKDYKQLFDFIKNNKIKKISFIGGEPTLYIDSINRILTEINSTDVVIQIVTNGWFLTSGSQTKNILNKLQKIDSIILSVDKFHGNLESLSGKIFILKNYCKDRIKLRLEVCIINLSELIDIKKELSGFEIDVRFQFVTATGRASKNNINYHFQEFQNEQLDLQCPSLDKIFYHYTKGFSFCCSNLVYGKKIHDKFLYFENNIDKENSFIFNQLKSKTFREIMLTNSIKLDNFTPQESFVCNLCEKLINRLQEQL